MLKRLITVCLIGALISPAMAETGEKISKKLATALIAGRGVIAKNQGLINDASKGDKGLTSDLFIAQMTEDYKAATGIDLAALKPVDETSKLLIIFVESVRKVIDEAQATINKKGVAFKGFIPAVFGKRVGDAFEEKTGIRLKQTSMRYRNRSNRPDDFEKQVLQKFEAPNYPKGQGHGQLVRNGDDTVYRYMQPLYIKKACLKCHGDPAGELDIAGRKKEGYKVGDVRGAISVKYPVTH